MAENKKIDWDLFDLYQKFYNTLYAATKQLPDGSRQLSDLFDEKALGQVTRDLADVLESAMSQRIKKGETDPRLTAAIGKAMNTIAFPPERHNEHPNLKCRYVTHDIISTDEIESYDSVNSLLKPLKEEGVDMTFPAKDEDIKIVAFHPAPKPQPLSPPDNAINAPLYTHTLTGQESQAVESLPDLTPESNSESQKKTGTDDRDCVATSVAILGGSQRNITDKKPIKADRNLNKNPDIDLKNGESGIRTRGTANRTLVFETSSFSHSDISPNQ